MFFRHITNLFHTKIHKLSSQIALEKRQYSQ